MQFMQRPLGMAGRSVWVRRVEHGVLRIVSLAFSLASAHAIRWFFAPLDGIDVFQPIITWVIALGFGLLGYFVSRGLAHRLMNHERIRAYAPICLVVEFVEIVCNYALAAAVIQRATWLHAVPPAQRALLTLLTYVVLSIIPLVSLLLAVVDMDMERSKNGVSPMGIAGNVGNNGGGSLLGGLFGKRGAQPKVPSFASTPVAAGMNPSYPAYGQGYSGSPVMMGAAQPGGKGNNVPFASPPISSQASARPTVALGSSSIP